MEPKALTLLWMTFSIAPAAGLTLRSASLSRRRAIAAGAAAVVTGFHHRLAGAETVSDSQIEAAIAQEEREISDDRVKINRDAAKLKKDRQLEKELDKEVQLDRKLMANAKENGDDLQAAELEGKINSLLTQEAKTRAEEASLKAEIKLLEEVEFKEEQKLAAEQKELDTRRSSDDMSAGIF